MFVQNKVGLFLLTHYKPFIKVLGILINKIKENDRGSVNFSGLVSAQEII